MTRIEYAYDATVQSNCVLYTDYTQNYLLKNIESRCILIGFFFLLLNKNHIDKKSLQSELITQEINKNG